MQVWKAGLFSVGGKIAQILITFVSLAILGRLITPVEFGIFALITAVHNLVRPFQDLGLTPAYIKLQNVDDNIGNVFFSVNFIIGSAMCVVMVGSAPIMKEIYNNQSLLYLMILYSFSILFVSMSSQPMAVLYRNKKFKKLEITKLIILLFGTSVAIVSAIYGCGVWSLVYRVLFEAFIGFIIFSYHSNKIYKLVGISKILKYKGSIGFGVKIVVSRVIYGINQSLDRFVLGKYAGIESVGYFSRASDIAKMPDAQIGSALAAPALSYLSTIKGGARLEHYQTIFWVLIILVGVPCVILILEGNWILPWLMGQQWVKAGLLLQWLGIFGLGQLIYNLTTIFHINESSVRNLVIATTICIPSTLLIPTYLLMITHSLNTFVEWYACCNLLYWFVFFNYSLLKKYRNYSAVLFTLKYIIMLIFVVVTNLYVKKYLLMLYGNEQIGFSLIFLQAISVSLVFLVATLLFARNELRLIVYFMRK